MLTALLDTSVLWPSLQRDFLLSLAVERLYRPVWSEAVLAELEFHEAAKLTARGADSADARRRAVVLVATMRGAFEDALVVGWEHLEGTYGLPDVDDEHVVAAAVTAGADVIVTANLRDFPAALLPGELQAVPPAEFAAAAVSADLSGARRAVAAIADRSGRVGARWTEVEVLQLLVDRYGMQDAVVLLRS